MEYILAAGLVLCLVLIAAALATAYQLIMQNGRMLYRVEALEKAAVANRGSQVEDYLGTLPAGVPAPAIDLPDLNGNIRSLAEWRGQRVLLVFVDPACAFSRRLVPLLAALTSDPVPGRPIPVLVSTGSIEASRAYFDEVGYNHPVLVQTSPAVAASYKVDGTPMSYLIDADGIVAGELAAGVQATMILAGEIAAVADATETVHKADTRPLAANDGKPVALEDGLPPGTTAPIFRLPRVGGGELSLLEFRGQDVIVLFADPDCEPCIELLPRLVEANSAIPIVVISRGEPASNEAMILHFHINFPVIVQRHYEIAREYGSFQSPAAFWIDEWGVVVANVAIGADAVMELVSRASSQARD